MVIAEKTVERITYATEWLDNVILKGKLILTELAKETFRRYREVGKLVLESGYRKGQWHSEHRRKACEEWNISQTTFSRMVRLGEMADQEFSHVMTNFSSLDAWINQNSRQKKSAFEFQLYNVWNFGKCDDNFGSPDFEGRIPAQIIRNILYYFSEEGDLVVDPMVGGGTTIDVCNFMKRNCLAYDIKPVRDDITEHDIDNGFPQECVGCDLIFLDPPYFNMVFDLHPNVHKFYNFMETLAQNCFTTIKKNGIVALLMQDMTEKGNYCLSGECYRIFRKIGFEAIAHISCPLSTQQFLPQQVEKAKNERRLLGRNRDLYVFRKV